MVRGNWSSLCEIAREINLQVDPDSLIEDGNDVIAETKVKDGETIVSNPALATGTQDLSMLQYFNAMDVFFSYFLTSNLSTNRI